MNRISLLGLVTGLLLLVSCGMLTTVLSSTPAPVATPIPVSTPAPTATPAPLSLFLEIASVTSPVNRGDVATLTAKTVPGAQCSIQVNYKSGPSKAAGLSPKSADASGLVSWSWNVGSTTTPGSWKIVVTAEKDGNRASATIFFTVQ